MRLATVLSFLAAPIVIPAIFALEVVDTVIMGNRTTLGNDLHAQVSNKIADLSDEPRPFDES